MYTWIVMMISKFQVPLKPEIHAESQYTWMSAKSMSRKLRTSRRSHLMIRIFISCYMRRPCMEPVTVLQPGLEFEWVHIVLVQVLHLALMVLARVLQLRQQEQRVRMTHPTDFGHWRHGFDPIGDSVASMVGFWALMFFRGFPKEFLHALPLSATGRTFGLVVGNAMDCSDNCREGSRHYVHP